MATTVADRGHRRSSGISTVDICPAFADITVPKPLETSRQALRLQNVKVCVSERRGPEPLGQKPKTWCLLLRCLGAPCAEKRRPQPASPLGEERFQTTNCKNHSDTTVVDARNAAVPEVDETELFGDAPARWRAQTDEDGAGANTTINSVGCPANMQSGEPSRHTIHAWRTATRRVTIEEMQDIFLELRRLNLPRPAGNHGEQYREFLGMHIHTYRGNSSDG